MESIAQGLAVCFCAEVQFPVGWRPPVVPICLCHHILSSAVEIIIIIKKKLRTFTAHRRVLNTVWVSRSGQAWPALLNSIAIFLYQSYREDVATYRSVTNGTKSQIRSQKVLLWKQIVENCTTSKEVAYKSCRADISCPCRKRVPSAVAHNSGSVGCGGIKDYLEPFNNGGLVWGYPARQNSCKYLLRPPKVSILSSRCNLECTIEQHL